MFDYQGTWYVGKNSNNLVSRHKSSKKEEYVLVPKRKLLELQKSFEEERKLIELMKKDIQKLKGKG
jgi:hypothetical protein